MSASPVMQIWFNLLGYLSFWEKNTYSWNPLKNKDKPWKESQVTVFKSVMIKIKKVPNPKYIMQFTDRYSVFPHLHWVSIEEVHSSGLPLFRALGPHSRQSRTHCLLFSGWRILHIDLCSSGCGSFGSLYGFLTGPSRLGTAEQVAKAKVERYTKLSSQILITSAVAYIDSLSRMLHYFSY